MRHFGGVVFYVLALLRLLYLLLLAVLSLQCSLALRLPRKSLHKDTTC